MHRVFNRLVTVFAAIVVIAFAECRSFAANDDPNAFKTISGATYQAGGSSMLLSPTAAPDVYELYVFNPVEITPIITGDWEAIGFVLIDQDLSLGAYGYLSSSGTIPNPGGSGGIQGGLIGEGYSISGTAVLLDASTHFFSGVLVRSTLTLTTPETVCSGSMLVFMPFELHADLAWAGMAATEMAASANLPAAEGGDDVPGLNQDCFDAATNIEECAECTLKCVKYTLRRHDLCTAACPAVDWTAVLGCAGGGGAAGGAIGTFVCGPPGGAIGGCIGGVVGAVGGLVGGRWVCKNTCTKVRNAEIRNCNEAYLDCAASH